MCKIHIKQLFKNTLFTKYVIIILSNPDIIVITGDLIDRRRFDLDTAMCFINEAVKIAPIYYVSGNHEAWSGKYEKIKQSLTDAGVLILDDNSLEIFKDESSLQLLGLSDPDFLTSHYSDGTNTEKLVVHCMEIGKTDGFKILQFNAVVKTNSSAQYLYEKLGFQQLGTIPGGFLMKDGHYEDICPYYHLL